MNTLEWTSAFVGRMNKETNTVLESSFQKTAHYAKRLQKELQGGGLPFISMPYADELRRELQAVTPFLQQFTHLILLGVGGSALGARALQKAFFPEQECPMHQGRRLWIADNVDARTLDMWQKTLPAKETLVLVISKSGGTIETISQYILLRAWLQKECGNAWTNHVFTVTDENNGFLREETERNGFMSLPVPDYLGGRYSVLSAVGLVPAAFLGIDWEALLDGAQSLCAPLAALANKESDADTEQCERAALEALHEHPSWKLALWAEKLMEKGYDQLIFFSYIPLWTQFAFWFSQLWAESLGKEGKGSLPIPATGVTDQHSILQMFLDGVRDKSCLFLDCPSLPQGTAFPTTEGGLPERWQFLQNKPFGALLEAEALGTRMAMHEHGVPLVAFHLGESNEENAGRLIALLECTTLFTGWLLGINPLDQPAVELSKRLANAYLGATGYDNEHAALHDFLSRPRYDSHF